MVMLQLGIQDSGQGIAPEQLEDIFVPFVQAGHSKPDIKGTGLGLAISKSFVDLLGGEISVESTPGIGSLFRIDLPVALAKEIDAGTDKAVSGEVIGLESGQAAWRVLVVEDNTENRKLLTEMLQQVGFEVREAENGKEGVAQFEQWQPHFIWMDMRMPVMDGYEATARIRQLPGGESVKIVAITASAFVEQHKKILESGCNDVVRKPYRANEMFGSMQKHLGVRFIYDEEAGSASTKAEQAIDMGEASRMAAMLPDKLFHDLEDAVTLLDIEESYHLLEQVDKAQPELADMIRMRLDEMDFTTIQTVIERE
jgi:CheY-like chemotaxis protein